MADIISNHLKVVQTISDAAPAVIIESRRGEDVHLRTTVSRSRWRRGTVLHAWSDGPQLNMPPKTDVRVWKFAGAGRPGEYGGLPGDLWMHVDVKRNWGVLALVSVLTLVSIGAIGWVLTGGLSAFGG
ncbi:MAG: hypothetical protein CSB46_02565 [Micrococcales bacterium]|nr:MAG: hypothetical protein CSB46_02565 [Micrococcales bacterium]